HLRATTLPAIFRWGRSSGLPQVAGRCVAAILLVLLWYPSPAAAQPTSVLQGRVVDASGGVVPDATVEVRDDSTRFAASLRTDSEGRYRVGGLPARQYT